uniref:Uncharacterized protein n=1 Tax=Cacopsylla melanoneura TaxID=428564 RepID=A0A8D8RXF4_9HEMI
MFVFQIRKLQRLLQRPEYESNSSYSCYNDNVRYLRERFEISSVNRQKTSAPSGKSQQLLNMIFYPGSILRALFHVKKKEGHRGNVVKTCVKKLPDLRHRGNFMRITTFVAQCK